MRSVVPALLLALTLAVPAAAAEAQADRESLFATLGQASSEPEARAAEAAIWRLWMTAPDAKAQSLLDQALERRRWYDFEGALPYLDALIAGWPDYAEGWNQRATIYFLQERYERSLADVDEVLAREPRHFGALAGRAIILMRQGRAEAGQLALIEALAVNPWLRERALLIDRGQDL